MIINELLKSSRLLKKGIIICGLLLFSFGAFSQTVSGPQGYKVIYLGNNAYGDYTRSLILLHEAYNTTLLPLNNVIGTITAYRGGPQTYHRVSVLTVNTSAAYNGTIGTIQSLSSDVDWKLKTCFYNGHKYLAVDVPYDDSLYDIGFSFAGWSNSSAESLKIVNYMVNGQLVNQNLISNIQDFKSTVTETHDAAQMNVLGNLNVGTTYLNPAFQLQVKGKIRSQEVRVESSNWPDYVFSRDYSPMTLADVSEYIKTNKHLPGIPSSKDVEQNGIELGDMNNRLLKKVEELTLHLIAQEEKLSRQGLQIKRLSKRIRLQH